MSGKKAFSLGTVLSVTTGVLLCETDSLFAILRYLTGTSLHTLQLKRAADACKPHILSQIPALADIDASGVNKENARAWLDDIKLEYGDIILLEPLPLFGYQKRDPVDEAIEIVGDESKVLIYARFP